MPTDPAPRWFHCTTHTYGAWLPGDPRGFRTRHHREHVEGDYKNPPPMGAHADRLAGSRCLLVQPPVVIPAADRPFVGDTFLRKLQVYGAEVLAVSVGGTHLHLLARMPPGEVPRLWVGGAKRQVTFALKARGRTGEFWATRSKVIEINDRRHQLDTFQYILDHAAEGAWVWDFRTERPS